MPSDMWLTYLSLSAPAGDLDYDLAVSADPTGRRRPVTPVRPPTRSSSGASGRGTSPSVPWLAISVAFIAVAALTGAVVATARRS